MTSPPTATARPRPPQSGSATNGARTGSATPGPQRTPSQVTLYVHLSADALTGATGHPGWVGNTGIPVTAGQIRDWCARPDTRVSVRPVIDLNTTLTVDGYEIPDRLREHIALRDRTCVFPWCSRPAHPRSTRQDKDGNPVWSTDADHIEPHATGGETSTDNLAPLCRKHHRLKTHTRWRYRMTTLGHYEWTSPHGLRFHRGPDGATTEPDRDHVAPPVAAQEPPSATLPQQLAQPGPRAPVRTLTPSS